MGLGRITPAGYVSFPLILDLIVVSGHLLVWVREERPCVRFSHSQDLGSVGSSIASAWSSVTPCRCSCRTTIFFLFDGLSAKAVVNSQKNLMMKIELCCAATKKNPERFNARGFVSCGLN